MKPDKTTYENFVWLQTAFIGDIVLTSAAIGLAQRFFPHIKQHVISTTQGCEIFRGVDEIQERIVFAKEKGVSALFKTRQQLKEKNLLNSKTLLLQPHRSHRSSLLRMLLSLPSITYKQTHLNVFAKHKVERSKELHEAIRIALLLQPLGISYEEILKVKPKLSPLQTQKNTSLNELWPKILEQKVVAIAVGSEWGTKRWPLSSYAKLVNTLLENKKNLSILLLGSPKEKELTQQLKNQCQHPKRLFDLAGKTSLDELRSVYPKLDLVISNDSSPVHYASAFNIPTLTLFGPTTSQMGFAPLSSQSISLELENLDCRPCSDHGPQVCPIGHFRCMKDLSVSSVYAKAAELLDGA